MELSSASGGVELLSPFTYTESPRISTRPVIRRAQPADVPALQELLDRYARLGLVLPRTPEALYRQIREYHVAVEGESVLACAGLRIFHQGLAEVVGVAVAESRQGNGLGRRIVETTLDEAVQLGIPRVFALTLQKPFFELLGFRAVTLAEIPEKIAADRVEGIDRTECRKIAMVRDLAPARRGGRPGSGMDQALRGW